MRNALILTLLVLLLGSCYNNAPDPGFDMALVIPADTMVSVLTDFHLADGMINIEQKKGRTSSVLAGEYFYTVLERHQLTPEQFDESIRYYSYYTVQLDKIYEQVITNLSIMESSILKP